MIQIFSILNSLHDTDMSRTETFKVFQGGIHHLFFVVGKGMTVNTL